MFCTCMKCSKCSTTLLVRCQHEIKTYSIDFCMLDLSNHLVCLKHFIKFNLKLSFRGDCIQLTCNAQNQLSSLHYVLSSISLRCIQKKRSDDLSLLLFHRNKNNKVTIKVNEALLHETFTY